MATFTIRVKLAEEQGTAHAVEVGAKDTVKTVLRKAAKELQVDACDMMLHHDGVALDELSENVTQTTLGEGSEVEARLTAQFVAKKTLIGMGLRWGADSMLDLIEESAMSNAEKAAAAQLMLDADGASDVGMPLRLASRRGLLEVVEVLAVRGVSSTDGAGDTPLHKAAAKGRHPVVQHLIGIGADPEARNRLGFTPLTSAVFFGSLPVVQCLVEAGADPSTTSVVGIHSDAAAYLRQVVAERAEE